MGADMRYTAKHFGVRAVLLVATVLFAGTAQAAIPQSEREALIAIYDSANGNDWGSNTNWCVGTCPSTGEPIFNSVGTECTWTGVTCDGNGSHVVGLYLTCGSGSIPSLNGLPALRTFLASACFGINRNFQLTGTIPDLSGLLALQSFFASSNLLSGPIPSLNGLTALQSFDVSYNNLSGEIPDISGLNALQGFDARHNQLTGPIPQLPTSVGLGFDVSYNQLSGSIPALPNTLLGFSADHNNLTGSIPSLAGVPSLTFFDVGTNQLTGSVPELTGLNLESFDISNNALSGSLPPLAGLPLRNFFIQGNGLSGPLPGPPSTLSYCNQRDPICQAEICPNSFDLVDSAAWDQTLGTSPWWASPNPNNRCDETFRNGFE
jgi:hypothetical protein